MLSYLTRLMLHYGHAFEIRGTLLSEYIRLRRREPTIPADGMTRIFRAPSEMEDILHLARFVSPRERVLLIDLGGNVGQWAATFLEFIPKTSIVAFEPDPRAAQRYASRFAHRGEVVLHQVAASSCPGQAKFHLAESSVYSSLENYSDTQAGRQIKAGTECVVQLATLDSFNIDTTAYDCTVLKIDVQGHELDALRGGAETLKSVDVLIVELSFASQYEGIEPSFAQACRLLHSAGLFPAMFQSYGRQLGPHAFERDVVFVRRNRLDRLYGWD